MYHLLLIALTILVFNPDVALASAAVASQKKAAMQKQAAEQGMSAQQQMRQQPGPPVDPEEQRRQQMMQEELAQAQVQDVADIQDVISSLSQSSRDWLLIIDAPAKEEVVSYFIAQFQNQGVIIHKPPSYYASAIDAMVQAQQEMLDIPLPSILQTLAVLDYDFDNGQNKDAMAMKFLRTQDAVMKNRQRLGLQ